MGNRTSRGQRAEYTESPKPESCRRVWSGAAWMTAYATLIVPVRLATSSERLLQAVVAAPGFSVILGLCHQPVSVFVFSSLRPAFVPSRSALSLRVVHGG